MQDTGFRSDRAVAVKIEVHHVVLVTARGAPAQACEPGQVVHAAVPPVAVAGAQLGGDGDADGTAFDEDVDELVDEGGRDRGGLGQAGEGDRPALHRWCDASDRVGQGRQAVARDHGAGHGFPVRHTRRRHLTMKAADPRQR